MKNYTILLLSSLLGFTAVAMEPSSTILYRIKQQSSPYEIIKSAISPDNRLIVTLNNMGKISLWDASTQQEFPEPVARYSNPSFVNHIHFSPTSRTIIVTTKEGIEQFDIFNPQALKAIENALRSKALLIGKKAQSPDGATIAVLEDMGTVSLWNATTGEVIDPKVAEYSSARSFVKEITFSPDSRKIIVTTKEGVDEFPVINKPQALKAIRATFNSNAVSLIKKALSPNGSIIATLDSMGTVALWDAITGEEIDSKVAEYNLRRSPVEEITFSPDSKKVVVTTKDGAETFDILDPQVVKTIYSTLGSRPAKKALSPDGTKIATIKPMGSVDIWDAKTGKLLSSGITYVEAYGVKSLGFTADSKKVVITTPTGTREYSFYIL